MIDIRHIVLGPLETNCYFLQDTETGDVLVFDPGWYEPRLEEVVLIPERIPQLLMP